MTPRRTPLIPLLIATVACELDEHEPEQDRFAAPVGFDEPDALVQDGDGRPELVATGEYAIESRPQQVGLDRICVELETLYADAGAGEDFWTSTSAYMRDAKGLKARILYLTAPPPFGVALPHTQYVYLGDGIGADDPGAGCWEGPVTPGTYYAVELLSEAYVNANTVRAYDRRKLAAEPTTLSMVVTSFAPHPAYGSTLTLQIARSAITDALTRDTFNVLMAAAHGIWRISGGVWNDTYTIWANGDAYGDSSAYQAGKDIIHIRSIHSDKKFLITHELAHAVYRKGTQANKNGTTSCAVHGADPRCQNNAGLGAAGHQPPTYEWSSCAFFEGFAHFYSTAVWNDRAHNNFKFRYYRSPYNALWNPPGSSTPAISTTPILDLAGSAEYPVAFGENICAPSEPPSNPRGTQLDWMRALWSVYDANTNATNMGAILDWIESADAWDPEGDSGDDVLSNLNAAAPTAIWNEWNPAQATHQLE